MQTSLSHRATLLLIGLGLLICILVGAILVNSYDISIQPKNPPFQGCSSDAMICPDGSGVGRVPPSCEFAACPPIPNSNMPSPTTMAPTDTLPIRTIEPTQASTPIPEKPQCSAGLTPYLSHCSCTWECAEEIPLNDCMRVCPQDN